MMNGKRVKIAIVCLWIVSILLSFIEVPFTAVSFLQREAGETSPPSPSLEEPPADITTTTPHPLKPIVFKNSASQWESDPTEYVSDDSTRSGSSQRHRREAVKWHERPSLLATTLGYRKQWNETDALQRKRSTPVVTTEPPDVDDYDGDFEERDQLIDKIIHDILQYVVVEQEEDDWCSFYASKKFGVELFVIGLTIPCFVLLLVIYGRILFEVLNRRDAAEHSSKRLVLTTLMLIGSFTFCWMPFVTFELVMLVRARTWGLVNEHSADMGGNSGSSAAANEKNTQMLIINCFFNSLLMLSPLINPIIYAARLSRVRMQLLAIITCNRATAAFTACDEITTDHRPSIAKTNSTTVSIRASSVTGRIGCQANIPLVKSYEHRSPRSFSLRPLLEDGNDKRILLINGAKSNGSCQPSEQEGTTF